jgi:proteasome lid subunit RPN8/RPN11
VDRRNRDEIFLGWFHSHSFYHQRQDKTEAHAPSARRPAVPFLSEEDRKLHRICFPRAYGIALLVTDSPQSGMSWTTWGWHLGNLTRRAFHVIHAPLPAGFETQGETNEAKREPIVQ